MKTYLITGAAGFIGSSLASVLILNGNKVVTIDNLSTGFKNAIPDGVEFIEGDCHDINVIKKLESFSFDAIFHIAGQSSGEISFEDPVYDLQTNTQSTLLLLNLALKIKCNKFIYASTMSVYGDSKVSSVAETNILNSKSFYAVGKTASENYMKIYSNFGISCTALRLFNVYGPGQNMKNMKQGMVSIFLSQVLKNKHIHIKGSKDRFRDFVYIDDVTNAFIASLQNKSHTFSVINISTNIKTTIGELVEKIISKFPYAISVEFKGNTPGDQFGIIGKNNKALQKLSWKPNYNLDQGLSKMIDWLINNNVNNEK